MSNIGTRLESGDARLELPKTPREKRIEKANQQIGKSYALGLLIGGAATTVAGGVMAIAMIEDSAKSGGERALQCVTRELSKPVEPKDPSKQLRRGMLVGRLTNEMQGIIAKCRAEIIQSD